jgi:hypothetical protein
MSILNSDGDLKVQWSPDDSESVKVAQEAWKQYAEMGYRAFAMAPAGTEEKGEQLDEFDPNVASVIMVPMMQGG